MRPGVRTGRGTTRSWIAARTSVSTLGKHCKRERSSLSPPSPALDRSSACAGPSRRSLPRDGYASSRKAFGTKREKWSCTTAGIPQFRISEAVLREYPTYHEVQIDYRVDAGGTVLLTLMFY
jgi:hypothetical protein